MSVVHETRIVPDHGISMKMQCSMELHLVSEKKKKTFVNIELLIEKVFSLKN